MVSRPRRNAGRLASRFRREWARTRTLATSAELAALLEVGDERRVHLLVDPVLRPIDEVADDDQDRREDEHRDLDDQQAAGRHVIRGGGRVHAGDDDGDADDLGGEGGADLVDERLQREGDGNVAAVSYTHLTL